MSKKLHVILWSSVIVIISLVITLIVVDYRTYKIIINILGIVFLIIVAIPIILGLYLLLSSTIKGMRNMSIKEFYEKLKSLRPFIGSMSILVFLGITILSAFWCIVMFGMWLGNNIGLWKSEIMWGELVIPLSIVASYILIVIIFKLIRRQYPNFGDNWVKG